MVDVHDPNKDVFAQIWRAIRQEGYTFYSGSEGGFYIQIGEALEEQTRVASAPISVSNKTSLGGADNARQVMKTP